MSAPRLSLDTSVVQDDIRLASIESYRPFQETSARVQSFASHLLENRIPNVIADRILGVSDADTGRVSDSFSETLSTNPFTHNLGEIQITDQYAFDPVTTSRRPQWFKSTLSQIHRNDSIDQKVYRFRRVVPNDSVTDFIKVSRILSGTFEIIESTAILEYIHPVTKNWTAIPAEWFKLEIGPNDLYISTQILSSISEPTQEIRFRISFRTILPTITISEDAGYYRLGYRQVGAGRFQVTLYTVFERSYAVQYNVEPSATGSVAQETTRPIRMYLLTDSDNFSPNTDQIYKVEGTALYISNDLTIPDTAHPLSRITLRRANSDITFLQILSPPNVDITQDWFVHAKLGNITVTHSVNPYSGDSISPVTYHYEFLELSPFKDIVPVINQSVELASIVSSNTIQVFHDILYSRTYTGGIQGFTVTRGPVDLTPTIVQGNEITLREPVGTLDVIEVNYQYETDIFPITHISMNPWELYNPDPSRDVLTEVVLFLLFPNEARASSLTQRSVFHIRMPKYRLDQRIEYLLEATGNPNIVSIFDMLLDNQTYIDMPDSNLLINNGFGFYPIVLGIVSVDNIFNPDIVQLQDLRLRGGGLATSIDETLLEIFDEGWNTFDIALYDGEAIQLAGFVVVKIPTETRDKIRDQFVTYHPDAVIESDASVRLRIAEQEAIRYIESRVAVRMPTGKDYVIEYY